MSNKNTIFQSIIGCGALALTLKWLVEKTTHAKTAPIRTSNETSFAAIDAYLETQLDRLKIPGAALAIVEGDQIVHMRGFGRARPGGEIPTPQTPFFIGSLTKSITALAVMQLVEANKVDLDAPVQRYLPWFRVADDQASASMTVRHLLNQTSSLPTVLGMTNLANIDSRPDAAERQARTLSTLKLARPVGTKFEYSNLNYNLLGLIIETASGEHYADYIHKHIFDPLEMCRSYTSKETAKQHGLAAGHRYWFGIPIAALDLPIPHGSLASGQLISTIEDMARYLIPQLNGGRLGDVQLLASTSMDELHRPAAEIIEMGKSYGSYGMGWIIQGTGADQIISHSGIIPDFGGVMALIPGQNKGFVLLYNANHAMVKMTLDELGLNVARQIAAQPLASFRPGVMIWLMRALAIIPVLQAAGFIATLRQLFRWQHDPTQRPGQRRMWGQHILLPLIPNLSFVAVLVLVLSNGMHRFMRFFSPDAYWITMVGGGFAALWAFLRTGLILRVLRNSKRK